MSKKTRKKSSKSPAAKAGRASSKTASGGAKRAKAAKAPAKAQARAPAKTSGKSRKIGAAKPGAAKTRAAKTVAAKTAQPKSAPAKKRAAASPATRSRTPSKAPSKTPKAPLKAPAKASAPKASAPKSSQAQSRSKQTAIPSSKPTRSPSTKTGTAIAVPPSAVAGVLAEGSRLPVFTLPRDGGERVQLAPAPGRNLVIFFYPRADTPGCTKEAMDFSRLAADFDRANTDVVGISADPQRAQEAFRQKYDLTMPLLSDESHAILEAFGVWGEKSMYGRTFLGILRTTVAVDPDGRISKIWRNVKVDGHAEDVLDYVRSR